MNRSNVLRSRVRAILPAAMGCIALLVLAPRAVWAEPQQISDGVIVVRLDPGSGRFAFFAEQAGRSPVSLLFEPDPRTSTLSVLEDNRIHRMGEGGGFTRTIDDRDGENRLSIQWRSASLLVSQSASLDRRVPGQVRVRIDVANLSETARTIGVRYLLDSAFSGVDGVFFRTASGLDVTTEFRMAPSASERYFAALGREGSFFAVVSGDGVTEPEAVVFANWKRLQDSRWDYAVSNRRGFSLIPFSMNDSAALLLYPNLVLAPGATRSIELVLGVGARPGERIARGIDTERAATAPAAAAQHGVRGRGEAVEALHEVNEVLREINRLLGSRAAVDYSSVEALRRRVEQIDGGPARADAR